jgi:LysM repeat protein
MILTVHVVVIGGMLLQGCKDNKDLAKQDSVISATNDPMATTSSAVSTTPVTSATPVDVPATINPNISNAYTSTVTTPAPIATPSSTMTGVVPPARSTDLAAPAATGEVKEYVVVSGDNLAIIAKKNGVSLKALQEANPGVVPKKLQIGKKLQIPAGSASMVATSSSTTPTTATTADATASDGSLYIVKSGDTLTKIAKSHGTFYKKIMAMNDLKSTSIHAGQKLKMPAPKATTTDSSATPATSASTAPPVKVSSAAPVTTSPVAAN